MHEAYDPDALIDFFDAKREQIESLHELNFIDRKENVVLLGPPGVGKTHLAISLAIAAAQRGRRVYYGTLIDLITSLEEAQAAGRLARRLAVLTHPSLLVVDEMGYLPINHSRAVLFFQLMNRRYERVSTVLTSNKGLWALPESERFSMFRFTSSLIAVALAAFATGAIARKPAVYPANKQTAQQQKKDEGECGAWAKQDTGIDPVAASQPAPQNTGPAVGGGERLKGAAGGAVIGGIAGDAGAGAAVGTVVGGAKARKNQQAQNQQAQQQQQRARNTYHKAFAACMEGRGYTVK